MVLHGPHDFLKSTAVPEADAVVENHDPGCFFLQNSSTHCVWASCERGLILITSCLRFAFKAAKSLSHSEDLYCSGFEGLCLLEPEPSHLASADDLRASLGR